MGYIKEPDGVDFIIKSEPFTDEDKEIISEFIRNDKAKQKACLLSKKRRLTSRIKLHA